VQLLPPLIVTEAEALLVWVPEVTKATAVWVPAFANEVVQTEEDPVQAPDHEYV